MTVRAADETIVAIATPPGRGALAIVRMSGPQAIEIGAAIARPWPDEPRHVTLAFIHDEGDQMLDEAVVVWYRSPASFTGENAVEITCHGGPIVAASIVAALIAKGARHADAGEFTRRAVLNGRLDLIQAEAIGDLVDAASGPAQRVALSQLDGGLSRRITSLREGILALEALAAYDIDFPEEDEGPVAPERIVNTATDIIARVDQLLATAPAGELVREGAVVVIAGAPNVGKSSLFNALLGRKRAIVTEIPGTTRDALEAVTEADGWPVRLVDTAGLRETDEVVERLGIEVSRAYLEKANVVLVCGDTDASLSEAVTAVASLSAAPVIKIRTKADTLSQKERDNTTSAVLASAESGQGLADVARAIAATLASATGPLELDAPLITRVRHRIGLTRARDELQEFRSAFATRSVPVLVAAVHLREATRALEELIGSVDVEDILDRLFSSFCVGK